MPKFEELNRINDEELDELEETPEYEESDYEESSEEEEEDLSDVEIRLEEANCFKALLRESLFKNPSKIALRVENKIRSYIKDQLRETLGLYGKPRQVEPVKVELPFTVEEIARLKALAQRMLEKEKAVAPQTTPTVQPQETPKQEMTVRAAQLEEKPRKKRKHKEKPAPALAANNEIVHETEVQLPNGQTKFVKLTKADVAGQVKPANYRPKSLQQIADEQANIAMLTTPESSDILGILSKMSKTSQLGHGEDNE